MSDIILARVSQALNTEHSLESLVRQLLEMLELVTRMESTYLTKVDLSARVQHVLYARNSSEMQIPEGFSVPWDDTLCKRAMDEKCFFANDVSVRWRECHAAQALGITTYFTTPVHLADGTFYGTLCATSRDKHNFSVNSEHVLQLFASLIASCIERESLVTRLREANAALVAHSYTDVLTGLANRRAVYEQLETLFSQSRHHQSRVLVAFIDLDDFKAINDRYGHRAGDDFLIDVGQRLTSLMGSNDIVGRLGGDEFLVACEMTASGQQGAFIDLLRRQICGRYLLGEHDISYPGASIGAIIANPQEMDAERAIQAADVAMYVDKKIRQREVMAP
ncbi:sensor domain-containing diguanylate cyclase [Pluralibacter sp.]|uniref:sensor domain-containing diguanylate cyclase n=1 Tax=Pluralibacter sp. TaxID=1920032 RepID=UPI0025E6B930|nr:sensor domain-containing diguanylate cyclase [Pluralibacter sp.]MBV8043303.1 sensor domain-containing diguanylate cyclase [Pluralibacter sp.]